MDFVIHDGYHEEHDDLWAVCSSHHDCPVCVACIVRVVEDDRLLPLQKKPALSELSRLLTQQPSAILQIFMQEERLVWHLLSILIGNLQARDDNYVSLSIETTMKLVQQVKSEDLVACVLDAIDEHVQTVMASSLNLLPHVTLLGKMVQYLPALTQKLLTEYGDLLQHLSLALAGSEETLQSSVAYLFIFLCEEDYNELMSTRLHRHIQEGLFHALHNAQTESLQINALGLLMKMIVCSDNCYSLMTLKKNNSSVLASLKRLLLNKKPALQIGVIQVLTQLLSKPEASQYGTAILESDITGIESILHAMTTARELKNGSVLKEGYKLLAEILERQPSGIPLFINAGPVNRCLGMIRYGVEHPQSQINSAACTALTAMVRKEHLLLPVPLEEIGILVAIVTTRQEHYLSAEKNFQNSQQKNIFHGTQGKPRKDESLKKYIELMVKVCILAQQCKQDERSVESNFSCPGSTDVGESSLEKFVQTVFRVCDEACIPIVMVHWASLQEEEIQKFLQLLCLLYDLHGQTALGIVDKLTSAGFLSNVIDSNASFRDAGFTEVCSRFLTLVVRSCHNRGVLPADHPEITLTADTLPWNLNQLGKVFAENHVAVESIEAYIHILFICFSQDNRVLSVPDLAVILTSALERHTSLQELSPLCRKHYLFLYAWMHSHLDGDVRVLRPAVRESLCWLLECPWEEWYSHHVVLLSWCFSNDVFAAVAGQKMLDAYISNMSKEELLLHLENWKEGSEIDELFRLYNEWSFVSVLLESLATQTIDNVCKIESLLEWSLSQEPVELDRDDLHRPMLQQITELLQNMFLENNPGSEEHNIVGLLKVMLLLMKKTESRDSIQHPIDVKILHHIMNRLSKTDDLSVELDQACMLYCLAAVSSSKTENNVCALVIQNEEVMGHFRECLDGDCDMLHCISCDILVSLLQHKHLQKSVRPIEVNIASLMYSVCRSTGETQVAGLNLLAALFDAGMKHSAVVVQGFLTETQYRALLIYLQQLMLQEVLGVQESAIDCFGNMLSYLHRTNSDLGEEMLSQPWNNLLLDVVLGTDRSSCTASHVKLLTVFTGFEAGCLLIRENTALLTKFTAIIEHLATLSNNIEGWLMGHFLSKVVTNLRNHLPPAIIQKVKEYLAKCKLDK